ncbi:MAG TPA: BON domain-containing protein [Thermoleophilaceae bacterium]
MNFTNEKVIAGVRNKLGDDLRVPYPDEIAVEAFGGSVLLRGTVGSFAQRRAALADARRTRGVFDVVDELEVRLLNDDRRQDAEIRGAALQRLIWDPEISAGYLEADVKDGWVTLTGEVDFQFQSDSAFDRVARLRGVTGITNKIEVVEAL